jgi:ribose 5-phosphate isomerase A
MNELKRVVAQEIASRVKSGECIGVGTGSTVDIALELIGKRVATENLVIHVVPTSYESAWLCESLGLSVLSPLHVGELAWGFDGADEVAPDFTLIKGRGGALLKEKILAAKCKKFVVIVDESKLVPTLGSRFAVPVEFIPEARSLVEQGLRELGATKITLREGGNKHGPVITESGNALFDVTFAQLDGTYEKKIKAILGVVESGIFHDYTSEVLIGKEGRVECLTVSA